MSDAKVQFMTVTGEPCAADQQPARFTFQCVRRRRETCGNLLIAGATDIPRDGQNRNGGRAQWDWDGNAEAPTFSPSVNCESACGWHGYIRAGRCVNTSGADEPEPA